MSLSPTDRQRLTDAFNAHWKKLKNNLHPDIDEPVYPAGKGKDLTIRELADEILNKTETGKKFADAFMASAEYAVSANHVTVDDVVNALKNTRPPQPR